ncbi:MAG: MlaD family protein [Synechococcaceae cyanobacterium]|jgi:phospholipid/cholesterol/gamma-HCH transport system substrate-binding protein
MRRSVREALVGFSILAAVAGGLGVWFWLKGVSLQRNTWTIQARFSDAAGLAVRSPVSYRGVVVGNVRRIRITDQAVEAELEISDPDLRLARPVQARVGTGSLLGGDAIVALIPGGRAQPGTLVDPRSRRCDNSRMVCTGGEVQGVVAPTLGDVTETMQRLLSEAEQRRLVPELVATTKAFAATADRADRLIADTQRLSSELQRAVSQADPILRNLDRAAANTARATGNVANVTAALDNPRSIADLKKTLNNASKLTARWEAVGGDVQKLTNDPQFIGGMRSVAVGLGKFFDELYPANTEADREREQRHAAEQERIRLQRQADQERLAPRTRL